MTEKQQEEIDLLKELIAESSTPNDEREIYQKALTTLLSQSGSEEPKVAKKMMPKKEKATPKTKATKKPKATKPAQLPSDVEAMKKQIKERTGKTESECEDIIAQYRMLRNKAKVNGAKRIAKLKNSDDLIAGTNVITPVAQIEKDAEIVKAKIEKQVEQIENKAERQVVKKDKTKDEVKIAVEKKVIKELAKLSDDMVLKSTTFVKNIQTELKKVDKTEAKNFLLGLRNEIDALLSKFGDGGTTEIYNIAEMNSSSSSVNPSKFARGGEVIGRYNGNNQFYKTPLPKIVIIQGAKLNDVAKAYLMKNTKLDFKETRYDELEATPNSSNQIVTLLLTYNWKTRYYNNSDYKNELHLYHNLSNEYENGGEVGEFKVGDDVKFNQDPSGRLGNNIYYGTILEINNGVAKISHQNSNMKDVIRNVNLSNLKKYARGGGVMSDGSKKSFGQLDFNQLEYIFNVQLFGIEEEETKKLLDELNKEWLEMTKEEKKEILERYDEEILGKYENGGDVKEKIVKRFADYYEDENGNHVVSLTKEENGSGYYFLDTTNGFTGGVFKEKSRTKDALERYVRRYYKVVRKFADGGLIGNQKRIDLNENGKIDAEDFKLLRSSMNGAWRNDHKHVNSTSRNKKGKLDKSEVRYAKKNNPSRTGYKGKTNYARGGFVGKAELVWRKLSSSDRMNFLIENFTPEITPRSQEILVGKSYNFLPKKVKIVLASKYANVEEYAGGGGIEDSPRIYVADLEAYNNGRLNGEWLSLTDYNNADELMEAIQELLDKWGVEEYAIHDTEYIPSNLSSEYMGQRDFEQLYEIIDLANEYDLPLEVVQDVVSQYNASTIEEYQGKYDSAIDFAEQLVDEIGIESFNNFQWYLDISDTDRRLLANDFADSYVDDIKNEDGGNRVIEEAGLDVSEYEEADSERQEEMVDEAVEIVREEYYDTWYDGLSDPYYFLVEEQGLYSADDFAKADFVQIDYDKLADALEQDYTFIYDSNSDLYVFNIR